MKTVTKEHLQEEDNHVTCECDNVTVYDYSWQGGDCTCCPTCMVDWQSSQILALKKLVYKLSPLNRVETDQEIQQTYADLMMITLEDMEGDEEMDYTLTEEPNEDH